MQNLHCLAPQTLNYHNQVDNYDQKQEYLRKTIEVKNKNIDELLKELRQTKQLYQQYKNQYLAEEKKMKGRVVELTNKVELQSAELQKHKLLINKIKADNQANVEKEQKNAQNYLAQLRELTVVKNDYQEKYKATMRENAQLKQKNEMLLQKLTKIQDKWRSSEKQLSLCQQQLKTTKQQIVFKTNQWCDERKRLIDQIEQLQSRKKQKAKMSERLQAMQNKIINTLRKF